MVVHPVRGQEEERLEFTLLRGQEEERWEFIL